MFLISRNNWCLYNCLECERKGVGENMVLLGNICMVTLEKSLSHSLISLLSSKPRSNYLYIFLLNGTAIHMVVVLKNLPANAGDIRDRGLIPGSGRSPGEGNGNPLQYSCLENPMDRRTWWATVYMITKKLDMTKSDNNLAPSPFF